MQQAIPFKSRLPLDTNNKQPLLNSYLSSPIKRGNDNIVVNGTRNLAEMISENAVIVFARRGCCMSHVVKRLLLGQGVNPAIYEIDDEQAEVNVLREMEGVVKKGSDEHMDGCEMKRVQLPAVFIGGKLFGGLDRLMATHISGELVPVLKEAGALWL